ncbi:hypothetical protein L6164_035161 [Bauhinia variegata]|uniref:Uncharacterized protein n=1 Tax=Bauhinia variegata TaxID=167791 RepID=A0ACB9KXS5_BAUVA|nr:hypothetical protein L6164_035161 [Bauhinia variegata]
MINFDETELRLGLPGAESDSGIKIGKRVFSETTSTAAVDLKLNLSSNNELPSGSHPAAPPQQKPKDSTTAPRANDPAKPPAKYYSLPPLLSMPFFYFL